MKAKHLRLHVWSVQLLEAENVSYEDPHLVALCGRSPDKYDAKDPHSQSLQPGTNVPWTVDCPAIAKGSWLRSSSDLQATGTIVTYSSLFRPPAGTNTCR